MVWRGPMAAGALQQMLLQTNWGELDYLFVDMPPGTGDIQLTLCQKAQVSGAVIVTTPQDLALLDARKGIEMFNKVNVPVLGIVENMSTHVCSQCDHEEAIFGAGGGAALAQEYGTELLASLPLSMAIRVLVDSGTPTVVAEPQSAAAQTYVQLAHRLVPKLDGTSQPMPSISIDED
jgi:ATP-binding protein involved in chromosome partitioning